MLIIILNTITMSVEFHDQPDAMTEALAWINGTFSSIFIAEFLLKLIGLGPREYVQDPMNVFDAVLALNSVVEFAMGGGGALTVLRALRLARIVKLLRFMPQLQLQMKVLVESLGAAANFCLLLGLFMFIYAILGMYLFGAKFDDDDDDARSNFNNFYRSFITVFQLLTIEDWPGVMYNAVAATSYVSVFYFLTLLTFGNYILSNLFIAILLDSFAARAAEEEERMIMELNARQDKSPEAVIKLANFKRNMQQNHTGYMFEKWKQLWEDAKEEKQKEAMKGPMAVKKFKKFKRQMEDNILVELFDHWKELTATFKELRNEKPDQDPYELCPIIKVNLQDATEENSAAGTFEAKEEDKPREMNGGGEANGDDNDDSDWEQDEWFESGSEDESEDENGFPTRGRKKEEPKIEYIFVDVERSCCCFPPDSKVRIWCTKTVNAAWFDKLVLVCIMLNSLTMAMERPAIKDGSTERIILDTFNRTFNAVFLFEMTVKVIAWGFIYGENAYCKDAWNKLDGFLVTMSVIDFLFTVANVSAGSIMSVLKILRILRALRPLRVINKAPKLKRVVNCMMESLSKIKDTMLICGMVFLIFGILGMNLMGGMMGSCSAGGREDDPPIITKDQCIGPAHNGTWSVQTFNYDNLANSFLTLFYVVSFDGWVGNMFNGMDTVNPDETMEKDYSQALAMFFVLFLIIGNFMVLNLFVGVIVDSFNNSAAGMMALSDGSTTQEHEEEEALKREAEQKEAEEKEEDELFYEDLPPWRAYFSPRGGLTEEGGRLEMFITGVIVANVLCMAIEHYNQPYILGKILEHLNNLFSFIFFLEMIFKFIGFGRKRYFRDPWNRFDFFIVMMSFVGLFFDYIYTDSSVINPTFIRVLRVFRVARILKLVKSAKGLQALVQTVVNSMPQVLSVGMLLGLFFFIYACAGVQILGTMGCDLSECEGIDKHANFEHFPMAMLTLFRICTGDNGSGILIDAMRTAPDCDDSEDCDVDCCAQAPMPVVPFYFMSFTILAQFIMLNVVIAVLISALEEAREELERKKAEEETAAGKKSGKARRPSLVLTVHPEERAENSDDESVDDLPDGAAETIIVQGNPMHEHEMKTIHGNGAANFDEEMTDVRAAEGAGVSCASGTDAKGTGTGVLRSVDMQTEVTWWRRSQHQILDAIKDAKARGCYKARLRNRYPVDDLGSIFQRVE